MDDSTYNNGGTAAYGRTSPMVSAAPPALSNVRARGGEVGVANGGGTFDPQQDYDNEPTKPPLIIRILTCRCG